jgi:hypothetical protein
VPLTVTDLANHLQAPPPTSGSQQQTEMQRALDTAVQEVTRATGMLDAVTVTVQVSLDRGDSSLRLPYVRLASVGAVTDPYGYAVAPLAADPLAGLVDVPASGWATITAGTWSVVVTGKPWPAALVTAALDWAGHLYDVQRVTTNPADSDQPPPSFALPNRVEELLRPYRLAGAA